MNRRSSSAIRTRIGVTRTVELQLGAVAGDARIPIQKALLAGDNRLKQGVELAKVRESYEQALALAVEAGLEDQVRPLVEIRLADLDRLEAGSPPPAPPGS